MNDPLSQPVVFGRYLLLERIAVGGMAEVFASRSIGLQGIDRLFALKRILPSLVEDREFVAMFVDEARIATQLQHASIVQVLELGQHLGSYYLAMEYVSGRDVRSLVDRWRRRGQAMPNAMACFIASRMAEALDYAHLRTDARGQPLGLIHRDISPQNVLVSYDGEVKLIDFGIARAAGRDQRTQAGILKGKFSYMSPEQVRGLPVDHRSDLFAVGAVLYEMLTGNKLFSGENDLATLEMVRAGQIPPASRLNPRVTPALERVLGKILSREPDKRYQTGAEIHHDLQQFLDMGGGTLFSGLLLRQQMREVFAEEYNLERDRVRRWWEVPTPDVSVSGMERLAVSGTGPLPSRPAVPSAPAAPFSLAGDGATRVTAVLEDGATIVPTAGLVAAAEDAPTQVAALPAEVAAHAARLFGPDPRLSGTSTVSEDTIPPVGGGYRTPGNSPSKPEQRGAAARPVAPTPRRTRPVAFIALVVAALAATAAWFIHTHRPPESVQTEEEVPSDDAVAEVDPTDDAPTEAKVADSPSEPPAAAVAQPEAAAEARPPEEAGASVALGNRRDKPVPAPSTPPPPAKKPADAPPAQAAVVSAPPIPVEKKTAAPTPVRVDASPTVPSQRAPEEVSVRAPEPAASPPPARPAAVERVKPNVAAGGKPVVAAAAKPVEAEPAQATVPAVAVAPSASAASGSGRLVVICVPSSRVVVDGKDTGRWTPVTTSDPLELPVGPHRIQCVHQGGIESPIESIDVREGKPTVFRYIFR